MGETKDLAHDPRRLVQASELRIPLVLPGHTHGGQVVLPLIGAQARFTPFPAQGSGLRTKRLPSIRQPPASRRRIASG
jgi:hypothetical protein